MFKANSQNDRVYRFLNDRFGEWIPAPELAMNSGYPRPIWKLTSRISDVRKHIQPFGFDVQNKLISVDKVRHSFYRIVEVEG